MDIRPIRTEAEYEAALAEIDRLCQVTRVGGNERQPVEG